jgi:hypothetical protein
MRLLIGSFWRAAAYCLHPRVIALSVLPLVLMVAVSFALGYFFWDAAVSAVLQWIEAQELFTFALGWLESVGVGKLGSVLAPLVVLAVATPLIVLLALLLVALLMTPAIVELVAQRRFAGLERKRGGSFWASAWWSLWSTLLALVVLGLSLPLWLVPPLVLVLPPVIWGWLTYRVFAFDALAEHASREEREALMVEHRMPLLTMGVVSGFLGAAPSLLWASGAMFIALAPLLVPLAIWVYALVFAFASLWFVHYLLTALEALRARPVPGTDGGSTFAAPPAFPSPADQSSSDKKRLMSDVIDVEPRDIT